MTCKIFSIFTIRNKQNGAYLVDINKGSKGDVYYKFPKDDKHEELFMNWKIRKYGDKAI